MISLAVQGLIFYIIGYFGVQAWINNSYIVNGQTGFTAAALSPAPVGDMVRNLGNVFLAGHGFELMLVVAAAVAAAVLGTTLACTNTAVRVSYAMGQESELPRVFGKLHEKRRTPHVGVLVVTIVSAVIGAWGSLSIANLTAITILSNIGTFLLYGLTNAVAFFAFRKERGSVIIQRIIPNIGAAANIAMLLAIVGLGIVGGGIAQFAALFGLAATAVWMVIGVVYFVANSRTMTSTLLPFPGKEPSFRKLEGKT
jgi:amino acid transporter